MKKDSNLSIVAMFFSLLLLFLIIDSPSLAQEETGKIVIGEAVKLQSRILNEERKHKWGGKDIHEHNVKMMKMQPAEKK